jgi:hypothetical protein
MSEEGPEGDEEKPGPVGGEKVERWGLSVAKDVKPKGEGKGTSYQHQIYGYEKRFPSPHPQRQLG